MKAIAVFPGQPNSVHLAELPKPSVNDVPDGRGVLVKVLRVGVDGTDKEINAAEYGAAPKGYDFLVTGHESFGQVEAVGPNVTEFAPGDYVVATVRRPGFSIYDQIGTYDMTTDDTYFERGINLRHGFLTEYKVMVGTVNANREYFEMGVRDMAQAEAQYPGWLARLLTHPVKGLENYAELFDKLTTAKGAIKVFCGVAAL
jgi:threonine dehydrogenase-like Zn-dependent dehydrogenase